MFSRFLSAIGDWFGDEKPPADLGDPLDFESGPFLDYAISWVYIFKRLLIPREYRMKVGNVRCVSVCDSKKRKTCKT
ncbi:hypothetical protein HUJ05_005694 [Dendroctonus ponderosae]|nr:hypothetical protein HUJ05_005694 [Dendroctonus ponderosae]